MLNRYACVLFAVLGLLMFDWENPSPDFILVLDAFDGVADLVEMRRQPKLTAHQCRPELCPCISSAPRLSRATNSLFI